MADMKTLKVCLSKDLPSLQDRDSGTIYFLRDKLIIYLGKSMYHDPYAIVEDIPDEPVSGLLYFLLTDGTVRAFVEYQVITIAQIENEEQLELLKQTGSIFFVNSQRRYLDLQRRIVTLPYNNGTYELTVDMANSLKINEKTVIGFNPATNMFEIVGDSYDEMIFDYEGKNSNSVNTVVSDKRISSEIKISEVYGNIIKVASDGLYATVNDAISIKQFESWANSYQEYKAYMESYLRSLSRKIDENEQTVSSSTINAKILSALKEQYTNIEYALDKFNEYSQQFKGIENRVKEYSDKKLEEAYGLLSEQIRQATVDPWEEFTVHSSEPEENEASTSGDLSSDYNTGVEDQGTTNDTDGDDTTPTENTTSEEIPEDNENIQGSDSSTEPDTESIEDEKNNDISSSEITETGTFKPGDDGESTEPVENPENSTEPENSEENPANP